MVHWRHLRRGRTCAKVRNGAFAALACFALTLCAASVHGQYAGPARRFYPEEMRADLAVLWSTVQKAHPDPYKYLSERELSMLVDTAYAHLSTPKGAEGFIKELMPILRGIGDAGTWVAPPAKLATDYERTGLLIPLNVLVSNDRLYLDEELKGFRSLPSGCELLFINGLSASDLLNRLRAGLVPEGANTTRMDRAIEQDFPVLYRRFVGYSDRFVIGYRDSTGDSGQQVVFAITGDQMRQFHSSRYIELQPWRMEVFPDTRSAWLTLATMDRTELSAAKVVPEKFLNNALTVLRKSKCRTLVVDLRGAGGADMAIAEQVFAMVAQAPYRVISSMSIGSGAQDRAKEAGSPVSEFYASVGDAYLPEDNGRRMLRPDDPRLMHLLPVSKAFKGKLYVICDGATTEAGAALAMLAKRTGRGRLVGEETGSNAASFCSGRKLDLVLPSTGCHLHLPLTRYVPEGTLSGPADHGEPPTYTVPRDPNDLARGKDTIRETLMMVIKELQ